jgi:oligosaccharyltransferase complex subunit alpha (ribophorin I)
MIRLSVFCVLLAIVFVTGQEQDNLVNTNVDRTLDLVSHIPKETITVTIENRGTKATRYYDYYVEPQHVNDVAYVGAVVKGKDNDDQASLPIKQEATDKTKGAVYRIELPNELRAGQTITLEIEVAHAHALRMYPTEITQGERQLVLYKTNANYYSRYTSQTQKTTVTLPTDRAEAYTQTPKPVAKSEQTITYGPYENVAALTRNDISLHYENNNPFLTVSNLKRWIEVSHWGNIAVEETIDIYHSGAKLKGPFSRLDFQRRQDSYSAVKTFKTSLPASARDIYYRDEIGNVSTSHVREMQDQVEVEIRPRFPLYGGWKTHYILGYNVPSYQYLYNKGNQYVLKMRLVDHVYDDQLLEQVTVKIVLPEHARNIEFYPPPYDVQRLPNEKHYTYLDTVGRPVIVINKRNMLFQHIQDFEIHYTFDKIMLFNEPMLIVIPLFGLFCLVIVLVRLDFAISHNETNEVRMRIQAIWDQIVDNNSKRTSLYQKLDDALSAYKTNKELKVYNEQKKKLESELKTIQLELAALQLKIKVDSADSAEKIAELIRLDVQQREVQQALSGHTEKLVNGKIQKPAYLEQEQLLRNKLRDINTRVSAIINQY